MSKQKQQPTPTPNAPSNAPRPLLFPTPSTRYSDDRIEFKTPYGPAVLIYAGTSIAATVARFPPPYRMRVSAAHVRDVDVLDTAGELVCWGRFLDHHVVNLTSIGWLIDFMAVRFGIDAASVERLR